MNLLDESTRSEKEIFDELESLCSSPGYIHVLAYISYRDNLVTFNGALSDDDVSNSYVKERTIRTEFSTLMGLMIKHPIDFNVPPPEETEKMIIRTEELLSELHNCLKQPMITRMAEQFKYIQSGSIVEPDNPFKYGDVFREAIFYGGESAYSFQYRDFAKLRYLGDNDWLQNNKGFCIEDGKAIATAIAKIPVQNLNKFLEYAKNTHPDLWTYLPLFTFSLDEVATLSKVPLKTTAKVLDAFTIKDTPTNKKFISLSDFNLANAFPVIHTENGDYVSLQSYGLVEAIYDSPFYWMAADKNYRETAFSNRGKFTEKFVADRLATVFSEANVHSNVNIKKGGNIVAEIDILVTFADRALVIQCKSKKLTLEARKGNDQQLHDDFKKSVQASYDQAYLCSKFLNDPQAKFVDDKGNELSTHQYKEIYPICVVSDHYPALTVQAREFLLSQTNNNILNPLITDIFLIDALAEMLASPLHFLSYLNRRVNYGERISTINELTILSCHLRQNLWISTDIQMMTLDDSIAIPLDTAMTVRREGLYGERTPKGILTEFKGTIYDRIIRSIEHRPDPNLIDLGFMLLTLDSKTIKQINDGISLITRQSRNDNKQHDISLCFDDGKSGLTVHCSRLSNSEAFEKLNRHCRLRKYAQHAHSWFGLVVRVEDGLPKFGVNLSFPWKQNSKFDQATKGMDTTGAKSLNGINSKSKVGRNKPCPCGSGLKFKKCCI
ncbi:SEC-C metal-binding domain-containing protein [Parasphingorhabdus sp. JC815]|uniref:SEC-C metal-binding domain-containing protein n=1 Tax=Parasphingorhabdus sp. JC815 TaxID=3232140 RepID=UPI0034573C8B